MGFFSPWFLAGLAAVGLPIWFHLLRRHKSTPLPFSSLMFFERRTQSSIKHRRLRYLLLFALRTLLVVLLALAFASPFISGKLVPVPEGGRMLVLAIDDSFSMRQGNRLARAKQEAARVLADVRRGERAQVIAFAGQTRLMGAPTDDPGALRAAIEGIEAGDGRSAYGDLARGLRSIAQSARMPIEVHLFSDLQKSSMPPGFADLRLPEDAKLVVHPAADSRLSNWAVESVTAPRRVPDPKKAGVQATIRGFGTEPATREVALAVNDKVLATKTVEVPAGGRATVEFESLDVAYGRHRAEVRLTSSDSFAADDRFRFAVEREDPRRVLFIHEARDTRSPLYFRAALEASGEAAFALEPAASPEAGRYSPDKFAFVVLSNVMSLPKAFEGALEKYVRGGGSVLVALGPASAVMGRVPVSGAPVVESRYSTRQGERFLAVDWVDAGHPSIRRANRWDGVRFYQVMRVEPGKGQVAARLTDQTPVLIESKAGAGRVLVFASTFDNFANDFPLHASFVPFVEQTARYLSGFEDRPGNFTVGAYLELRASREHGAAVEVLDPDGKRALSLSEASTAQGLTLDREGFYEVRWSNGRQELFAVNADRRESDFEMIPKETLSLWENTGQGGRAASGTAREEAKPRSLWWPVLLAAMLVALAESVVGSRYLSLRKEADVVG